MEDKKKINSAEFYKLSDDPLDVIPGDSIPFKEELLDIFNKQRTNEKGKEDKILSLHASYTIKFAESLLKMRLKDILKDKGDEGIFLELYNKILAVFKDVRLVDDDAEFFKISALFHDIGKHIEVDNHPQIGLYLVRDFYPDKRKRLAQELGTEYFALLCSVIQHHDKFGVVSTGEASLPIFADVPYLASNSGTIPGVKKNLAFVCLCNLIDIASSIPVNSIEPIKLKAVKIKAIADDWESLLSAVDKSNGEREQLKEILLEQEYKAYRTINRIERLIKSAASFFPGLGEKVNRDYLQIIVPRVLQCNFNEFSQGLAHITKLDYGLRFFNKLVEGICRKKVEERIPNDFRRVPDNDKNRFIKTTIAEMARDRDADHVLDEITIKILKILERFVLRYRWILTNDMKSKLPCRIGYEMRGVIGDEKLTSAIISGLLCPDSEPAVLSWITDKTPIWSFD